MGIDIHGWVEVGEAFENGVCWSGIVRIDDLITRDYDLFGMLFGVADTTQLPPIAAARGLPNDLSETASDDYVRDSELEFFGETWLLWSEYRGIAWDVSALDNRPHRYETAADGTMVFSGKAAPLFHFKPPPHLEIRAGTTWTRGGILYRFETISRREILAKAAAWQLLFDLMARLAQHFGDDQVRLVVSFDK